MPERGGQWGAFGYMAAEKELAMSCRGLDHRRTTRASITNYHLGTAAVVVPAEDRPAGNHHERCKQKKKKFSVPVRMN